MTKKTKYIPKRVGRPTADGAENVCAYRVTLDAETWTYLRGLGDGELSRGIRKAARLLKSI